MKRVALGATAGLVLLTLAASMTGFAATLEVDSGTIDTFNANVPATTTTTSPPTGDTTAPVLQTLEMFDVDTDGKVDRVVATFDETLVPHSGTTGWTLTNVPSGGQLASVNVSDTTATLAITEGSGDPDTAVGDFRVTLSTTSPVRDAAGHKSSFAATAPADKAAPVPWMLTIANGAAGGNSTGTPQQKDTVALVWSEVLAANSLCDGQSGSFSHEGGQNSIIVHIDNNAAPDTSNDRLRVTVDATKCNGSFSFGYIDLGSTGFVTQDRTFQHTGNGNASAIAWSESTQTLTVTLGSESGSVQRVNAPVTATYHPSPPIADGAGNTASRSVARTATHF